MNYEYVRKKGKNSRFGSGNTVASRNPTSQTASSANDGGARGSDVASSDKKMRPQDTPSMDKDAVIANLRRQLEEQSEIIFSLCLEIQKLTKDSIRFPKLK